MAIARDDITSGTTLRTSRCVVNGEMVYLAGLTAADRSADIKGQTRQILDAIDGYLAKAGTDKSKLLQANVWITDTANFAATNGPGVAPIEQHGAIDSFRVSGGFAAAGGGFDKI